MNLRVHASGAQQGYEGAETPVLFASSLKVIRAEHKVNFSQALKRLPVRWFLFPCMRATTVARGSSCKASGGQARNGHLQSDITHAK